MNEANQSGRRLKVTLVVRNEEDDPSILDIIRVAVEDGLCASGIGMTVAQAQLSEQPERHTPIDERLESDAREAIEESLARVIEEFQATGKEPKFDPAKWAQQLAKVWAIVRNAKAAGVQFVVSPVEPATPTEGP